VLEEVLFAFLGLLVAFNVGHLLTLRRCESALLALTMESKALTTFDPGAILDEIKDEMSAVVLDVVNNMRPPTVADHLGGVLAQFAQMKMMRSLQESGIMDAGLDALSMGDGADVD
jgi:hypothetical protein